MSENNVYLLIPLSKPWGYDNYLGHVVIADSEENARLICPFAGEGNIWVLPELTKCDIIGTTDLEPMVVLSDFNAG